MTLKAIASLTQAQEEASLSSKSTSAGPHSAKSNSRKSAVEVQASPRHNFLGRVGRSDPLECDYYRFVTIICPVPEVITISNIYCTLSYSDKGLPWPKVKLELIFY